MTKRHLKNYGWRRERNMAMRWIWQRRLASLSASRRQFYRTVVLWRRRFADDPESASDECFADILLLPLAGLTFSLFVLSLPGASDAIASAYFCMG